MEGVEPPRGVSQMCPPIKLEPSSPNRFDYRGSNMTAAHPELHGMSTGYVSSSSSTDSEDLMLDINEDEGAVTKGASRSRLPAEVQIDVPYRDMSVPSRKEAEIKATIVALQNNEKSTHGLLRPLPIPENFPPPRRQKAPRRPVAPPHHPKTRIKLEDVAYNSIPDYAPPISTLPRDNPYILQVEWRQNTVFDLSQDPDRHMLHELEIKLASSLSLSCAKYLCTKRRIFQARFEALQAGRKFRTTDTYKICKIDVNKVSKLCGAFEKVGWFDKKYFLEYSDETSNSSSKASNEEKDRGSPSSGLTEPDIWYVSESDFYVTSEGDEESTDDDSADPSVSSDGRHDEIEGPKNVDSYRHESLRKQHYGLSLIGGDGGQRRVLNDRTVQTNDTLFEDEAADEGPTIKSRRPRQRAVPEETVFPRDPGGHSENDNEEDPVLKTRSMTQKVNLALNSCSEDKSDSVFPTKTQSHQQKSNLKKIYRSIAPTSQFTRGNPIPRSLDGANAADIMLVKMKEIGRPWLEIEEAWKKKTGKAQTSNTLSCRYARIMANIASTPLEPDEERDSGSSLTYPRIDPENIGDNNSTTRSKLSSRKQDQLLLAAEAEIEENFQREKADIIAEIETNFQLEKWNLVAEAMSRNKSIRYSAELIQAQYERLTGHPKKASDKVEEDHDIFTDLPRRTTRTVRGRKTKASNPSKSGVGRPHEASNEIHLPKPQHATTSSKKRSTKTCIQCERCGSKYVSTGGLNYHRKHHPNCDASKPSPYQSKKRKSKNYSTPRPIQPQANHQRPFTNPPASQVSLPNSMPDQTPIALPQVNGIDNGPVIDDFSLRPSADGAERGRQTVRKNFSRTNANASVRAREAWAVRRALGTNGRRGGPPKGKKAKMVVADAEPNARIHLAPTIAHQSGHSPTPWANTTTPITIEKTHLPNANGAKDALEQIIPAAPQTKSRQKVVKVSMDKTVTD